jgi:hypothetical protein
MLAYNHLKSIQFTNTYPKGHRLSPRPLILRHGSKWASGNGDCLRQAECGTGGHPATLEAFPKPCNIVVVLNDKWRVVDEDRQWILQKKKGRRTAKSSGYTSQKFHRSREDLNRSIREGCGTISPAAQAILNGLPDQYP